ncbi:peptidoglycan-binding protein [Streptomyces sp. 6-11-2]|uniref:L,D-transpeptidase family protein n=1 Tax=Streptomyces sp. 6-11-2 TaxID=2585753 RepID=UPI0011416786|nr:peptidoglycan-binding protein [Streptomyces sp. 6-11-2]
MNTKYRTSLRVVAVAAASTGILSTIGLAGGTAAAHDADSTRRARLAQPLDATHSGAKAVGVSHARQWPALRSGSRGVVVSAAQHLLTARGHTVKADGVYGSRTVAAVKAFQSRQHLRADGVVGPGTWNALTVSVRSGSRGHAVTAAQQLLTARGHTVKADGVYGSRTVAAVKAFQSRHHLRADGVVGPDTWNVLVNGSTGAVPAPHGYVLKFTKNRQHPDRSKLALYRDGRLVDSYRAGSGMGSTDECAGKTGWLPSGTYKILGHQTNRDTRIKGYAIHLADKTCHPRPGQKAVKRGDLFIHSKMTKNGTSLWRGDNDYKSEGCVKLAPGHIKSLFAHLDQAHWPKALTLQVS